MKRALIAITLALAACGAPSSYDLCNKSCAIQQKCGVLTDAQASNCRSNCDAMKGTFADDDTNCDKMCKNCAQIRSDLAACEGMDCNKVATCVQSVDTTCIQK